MYVKKKDNSFVCGIFWIWNKQVKKYFTGTIGTFDIQYCGILGQLVKLLGPTSAGYYSDVEPSSFVICVVSI